MSNKCFNSIATLLRCETATNTFGWLKNFFINYFWVGLCLILFSVMIKLGGQTSPHYELLSEFIQAVGVSVLVASIFSFASGSYGFIRHIQKLLEDIVISQKFLANMDDQKKKTVLDLIVKPTDIEAQKYSSIADYYKRCITGIMEISSTNIRSNYTIIAKTFKDGSKVGIKCTYSYRLYPSKDGFGDISIGFVDMDSKCISICIAPSEGSRVCVANLATAFDNNKQAYLAKHPLSGYDIKLNRHLDIQIKTEEMGADHWVAHEFNALQPTDGFAYHLSCDDDLEIKKYLLFIFGSKSDIEKDSPQELSIICNQWLNPGEGIAIVIGPKNCEDKLTEHSPSR